MWIKSMIVLFALCCVAPLQGQITFPPGGHIFHTGNPTASIADLSPVFGNTLVGRWFYVYGNDLDTLPDHPPWVQSTGPFVRLDDPVRGPLEMPFHVLSPNLMVIWVPMHPSFLGASGPVSIGQYRISLFGWSYDYVVDVSQRILHL